MAAWDGAMMIGSRFIQASLNIGSFAQSSTWEYIETSGSTEVGIDIKPGNAQNTINLGSQGVTPVAILSSTDFDATTVDPLTVELADATVRVRGNGTPQASFQDVNGDGLTDLVLHMMTEGFALTAGTVEANLTGETFGGDAITGTDSVRVIE